MSMTVTSSATKSGYSYRQPIPPFSLTSIMKALLVFGGCFQTGITPASAKYSAEKLPEYCTTRYELDNLGYPYSMTKQVNIECYLDNVKFLQNELHFSTGIDRLKAEFTLGRRLACPFSPFGSVIMSGNEQIKLSKELRQQHLEGIAHMHNSKCLEVIYPKEGQTVKECYKEYTSTIDADSINYQIDSCYYFVTGTLICPDKDTYEDLIIRASATI